MKAITYTAARENLAATINRVCEDNAPVMITRNRDQSVVMLSLAEYESLEETAHLLRSPANAKRLFDSLDSIKRGKMIRKKINLDE
jgi:antitoxin YefM